MSRGSTTGPFKSTAGFEIGAGGSGPDGTNTSVIDGDGNAVFGGTLDVTGQTTLTDVTMTGTALGGKATIAATVTGSVALTAAQSGTVFLVGTDTVTITLPATVAGVMYTFLVNDTTDPVTIKPNASDKIQGKIVLGTSTTTLALAGTDTYEVVMTTTNVAVGDNLSIVGDGGDGWIVLGGRGLGIAET